MFSNAVSFYVVKLLEIRRTNKLEDIPYRLSATAYSVYDQLLSISDDSLPHRILLLGHTGST